MSKENLQAFKELKSVKENSLDYEDGLEKLDATNPVESVNA